MRISQFLTFKLKKIIRVDISCTKHGENFNVLTFKLKKKTVIIITVNIIKLLIRYCVQNMENTLMFHL